MDAVVVSVCWSVERCCLSFNEMISRREEIGVARLTKASAVGRYRPMETLRSGDLQSLTSGLALSQNGLALSQNLNQVSRAVLGLVLNPVPGALFDR